MIDFHSRGIFFSCEQLSEWQCVSSLISLTILSRINETSHAFINEKLTPSALTWQLQGDLLKHVYHYASFERAIIIAVIRTRSLSIQSANN